jgi:hypothetical protein
MASRRVLGSNLTPAQQRARDAFKSDVPKPTGVDLEQRAFDENMKRLKALRLARDAQMKQE